MREGKMSLKISKETILNLETLEKIVVGGGPDQRKTLLELKTTTSDKTSPPTT
jgi:hypothetical protein